MKKFSLIFLMLFTLLISGVKAQTHTLSRGTTENGLFLSVEFTGLTGADQDSTTFVDVSAASLQQWSATFIPMDSTRALTTDTFTVYLKGYISPFLAAGVRIDTFTVIGSSTIPISNTGVSNITKTITPGFDYPYWGLEAVQTNAGTATKTKNRLACYLWSKGFNPYLDPAKTKAKIDGDNR